MSVDRVARGRAIASIAEAVDPKRVADEVMADCDENYSHGGRRETKKHMMFSFAVNDPATRTLMRSMKRGDLETHLSIAIGKFLTEDMDIAVHVWTRPWWLIPLRFRVYGTRESYYTIRALRGKGSYES